MHTESLFFGQGFSCEKRGRRAESYAIRLSCLFFQENVQMESFFRLWKARVLEFFIRVLSVFRIEKRASVVHPCSIINFLHSYAVPIFRCLDFYYGSQEFLDFYYGKREGSNFLFEFSRFSEWKSKDCWLSEWKSKCIKIAFLEYFRGSVFHYGKRECSNFLFECSRFPEWKNEFIKCYKNEKVYIEKKHTLALQISKD